MRPCSTLSLEMTSVSKVWIQDTRKDGRLALRGGAQATRPTVCTCPLTLHHHCTSLHEGMFCVMTGDGLTIFHGRGRARLCPRPDYAPRSSFHDFSECLPE